MIIALLSKKRAARVTARNKSHKNRIKRKERLS